MTEKAAPSDLIAHKSRPFVLEVAEFEFGGPEKAAAVARRNTPPRATWRLVPGGPSG